VPERGGCGRAAAGYGESVAVSWPVILVGGGVLLGLIVGRWWALIGPAGVGFWAGLTFTDLEVPAAWIGLGFATLGAIGVVVGVVVRRFAFRRLED
jgi:hypothetical protein